MQVTRDYAGYMYYIKYLPKSNNIRYKLNYFNVLLEIKFPSKGNNIV